MSTVLQIELSTLGFASLLGLFCVTGILGGSAEEDPVPGIPLDSLELIAEHGKVEVIT